MTQPAGTLTEDNIAKRAAQIGRQCGACSMCCFMLKVEDIDKPKNEWCSHCHPGKGCSIYPDRPAACRTYTCAWLVNANIPDYWRPLESGMIVDFHMAEDGSAAMRIHVHPDNPGRWLEEPFYDDIRRWAIHGATKEGRPYRMVIIGGEIAKEASDAA